MLLNLRSASWAWMRRASRGGFAVLLAAVSMAWSFGTTGVSARQLFPIDLSPRGPEEELSCGDCGTDSGGEDFVSVALEQLKRGCDPLADQSLGGNPYADSIIGRLSPSLAFDESQHQAMIAATLSQDPDLAFEYTAGLRESADPSLRYVGWLVPAYVVAKARRADYLERLGEILPRLARESSGLPSTDLDYLEAVLASGRGDDAAALSHIERALKTEPRFFNAILLGLRLRMETAVQAGSLGYRACDAAYRGLFRGLLALVDLTRCPLQASQSEIYLARMLRDPAISPPMLAARVYLGLMARKPKLARTALEHFDAIAELSCKRSISRALHRLLSESDHWAGMDPAGELITAKP
jgi:hypothetical protein